MKTLELSVIQRNWKKKKQNCELSTEKGHWIIGKGVCFEGGKVKNSVKSRKNERNLQNAVFSLNIRTKARDKKNIDSMSH